MAHIIIPSEHRAYVKDRPRVQRRTTIGDGTPRSAVGIEDNMVVHAIFTYDGMASLTKNGIRALNEALECMGFDISKPVKRFEDAINRQIEYSQEREWE